MPGVKSITVMVMVGAGSRYETREINGLSHFLEHMAFKGTKKRPSAEAISREIDAIGGEFNAFTSKDHTAFYIKAASQHLDLMLDILSDMLTNSLFKNEEIEREKGVIIEEINMYEDTPMRKVAEVFENLMFGDTPMGWDIAGKADIIRAVKREDFIKYVDSLYKTKNMVVAVAGGIEGEILSNTIQYYPILSNTNQKIGKREKVKDKRENKNIGVDPLSISVDPGDQSGDDATRELVNKVEKYFKGIKDEKTVSFEKFKQLQSKARIRVVYKKTEQAHLVLGFPSLAIDDPRKYALSILTTILGSGMSSRLFIQVRERRGLAYYVHASSDSYKDCGDFAVSAGVDLKRIDEAVKVILEEIYKVIGSEFRVQSKKNKKKTAMNHELITNNEFNKAKEYLKGHLILSIEDSESVAGLYASQFLLEEKVETPEEIITQIDKVTLDEVYAVAKEIFNPQKVNLAVIGPFKEPSRFEKLIKSGYN
jgi:predicted Zn-dependent peptidase